MFLHRTAFGISAFSQVDHVPCLAGSCSTYVEDLVVSCAPKVGTRLDVVAGEAVSGATWTASTGWLESGWLELCLNHEIPKVLWSSVGYQGPFGDGFFRRSEACSTGWLFFIRAVKLGRLGWYDQWNHLVTASSCPWGESIFSPDVRCSIDLVLDKGGFIATM